MNSGIKELELAALTCDVPEFKLIRGDVGSVVLVHDQTNAFEVEFVGYDGRTVALMPLERNQVRALEDRDFPHARELASTSDQ